MTSPTPSEPTTTEPTTTEAVTEAPKKAKPQPPSPGEVVRLIGETSEAALAYVLQPDPKLSRLSRKAKEALLTEVPPVTAAALLGPAALARHLLASAASGRYRDLHWMWELFRQRPQECKEVLAERPRAVEKGREALRTALRLGLSGHAEHVAEDVARAQGLVWTWVREELGGRLEQVGRRPLVAAALLRREPDLAVPLPEQPDDTWLSEAAAARAAGPLPEAIDHVLAAHLDRLPATPATLALTHEHYPQRLPALLDRVDLDAPDIAAVLAWARDHAVLDRLRERIERDVRDAALRDRAEGLARWRRWRDAGIDVTLPESLTTGALDGLDLGRPETAELIAHLQRQGGDLRPQALVDELASRNRQLAEKAYEAFVCAGLDVSLPLILLDNPIVKEGTRCPACQAWTWVRPGHEARCPRTAPVFAE